MPEVVLDLDSWESEYTRPYQKAERLAQQKKWAANPRVEAVWKRIKKFEYDRQRTSAEFSKLSEVGSLQGHWNVTDLDIMVAALKGPPKHRNRPTAKRTYGADAEGVLSLVAFKNAIPLSAFRDDKSLLNWLLHRKLNAPSPSLPTLPLSQDYMQKLSLAMYIRRYILFLLQQGDGGYRLVRECNRHIADALSRILQESDKWHILVNCLPFLNSLFALHQKNGQPLGAHLCGICLIISVHAFQPQAMERYLEHGLKEGYWVGGSLAVTDVSTALEVLLRRSWDGEPKHGDLFYGAHTRQATAHRSSLNGPKERLRHLLAGAIAKNGSRASFEAVLRNNPHDKKLHQYYWQLASKVGPLPGQVANQGSDGGIEGPDSPRLTARP